MSLENADMRRRMYSQEYETNEDGSVNSDLSCSDINSHSETEDALNNTDPELAIASYERKRAKEARRLQSTRSKKGAARAAFGLSDHDFSRQGHQANNYDSHLPLVGRSSILEYHNVTLYVPAVQVLCAMLSGSLVCVLSTLISTSIGHVNAVRTAAFSGIACILCVARPMNFSPVDTRRTAGGDVMLNAVRPSVVVYLTSLLCEQLVHSCASGGPKNESSSSWSVGNTLSWCCMIGLCIAGLAQAASPRAHNDYPFFASAGLLIILALVSPSPRLGEGPLCEAPPFYLAVERILRAVLFGSVYCVLAYASEPISHAVHDVIICGLRASLSTVWILMAPRAMLALALVQCVIGIWTRIRQSSATSEYEQARTTSTQSSPGQLSPRQSSESCSYYESSCAPLERDHVLKAERGARSEQGQCLEGPARQESTQSTQERELR